jgi:hypothetical protein
MYLQFEFKEDDPSIIEKLNEVERGAVQTWQTSDNYVFEFHTGHDTGYPLYIRPVNNRDKSNLPKFDTRNHTGDDYPSILDLANGQKLNNALGNLDKTEILNLISTEWTTLALLAQRFWTNRNASGEDDAETIAMRAFAQQEDQSGQHHQEISSNQYQKLRGFN